LGIGNEGSGSDLPWVASAGTRHRRALWLSLSPRRRAWLSERPAGPGARCRRPFWLSPLITTASVVVRATGWAKRIVVGALSGSSPTPSRRAWLSGQPAGPRASLSARSLALPSHHHGERGCRSDGLGQEHRCRRPFWLSAFIATASVVVAGISQDTRVLVGSRAQSAGPGSGRGESAVTPEAAPLNPDPPLTPPSCRAPTPSAPPGPAPMATSRQREGEEPEAAAQAEAERSTDYGPCGAWEWRSRAPTVVRAERGGGGAEHGLWSVRSVGKYVTFPSPSPQSPVPSPQPPSPYRAFCHNTDCDPVTYRTKPPRMVAFPKQK
jgi:hypothetical protein